MKKIKFIVAIVGITLATFGNSFTASAIKKENQYIKSCTGNGICATTVSGESIDGNANY